SATRIRLMVGACTVLALAFALSLAVLIKRALANPLHRATSVFGEISAGRYENEIRIAGTDEASQVLRALEKMQGTLRTQIETERAVAAENARIRYALDTASTSVLVADAENRIVYSNATARATLARAQINAETLISDLSPGVRERAIGALTF